MIKQNENLELDERLSNFTDRVLAEKSDQAEAGLSKNERELEETILRLKRAVPRQKLDDFTAKQWEARLANRLRKEKSKGSFWHRRCGGSSGRNGQALLAIGTASMAIVGTLSLLMVPRSGMNVTAAAFSHAQTLIIGAALLGLIIIVIASNRRR